MTRPFNMLAACGFLALCLPLSGCGHPWPAAATGGLAERNGPAEAMHADIATAILIESGRADVEPARVAIAEDHLVLAIREHAAGLCEDSEENTLAASIALGGVRAGGNSQGEAVHAGRCSWYFAGEYQ